MSLGKNAWPFKTGRKKWKRLTQTTGKEEREKTEKERVREKEINRGNIVRKGMINERLEINKKEKKEEQRERELKFCDVKKETKQKVNIWVNKENFNRGKYNILSEVVAASLLPWSRSFGETFIVSLEKC